MPEPVYEQGTISVTLGSEQIDGTGTAWDPAMAGLLFQIDTPSGPSSHRIAEVISPTRLRVTPPYPGTSTSGSSYHILPPLAPDDPSGTSLEVAPQKPLDLVLLGALHPPIAQALGLYWVDEQVDPVKAYDYLIVAAHRDFSAVTADDFLAWLRADPTGLDDPDVDAYIVYNRQLVAPAPLPKPDGLAAYALPTAGFGAPGAAGLTWDLGEQDGGVLLPGKPVLYHVFRADLGSSEPAAQPPAGAYNLITADRPVIALHSDPPGKELSSRSDWPPFRLHYLDLGLAEGWYAYQVCGIDIFGRYSR